MKSLIRKEFLNRTWHADDLNALAEFWLRLYEAAAPARGFTRSPGHVIEIRLAGFPYEKGEELRRELEVRAVNAGIPNPTVVLRDPHTLVLASEPESSDDEPPPGLGLPVLAGPPFDGLAAEIRFTASGREGRFLKTGRVNVSLVVIGELRGGGLVVKTLWRSGSPAWEDEVFWEEASPDEPAIVAGFEEFRKTGEVAKPLAKRLFRQSTDDRFNRFIIALIHPRLDSPNRLFRLLLRLGLFAAFFTLVGYLVFRAVVHEEWLDLILALFFGVWPALLFILFAKIETRILFTHRLFREQYRKMYEEAGRFASLSADETATLLDDPMVRKYTAELTAAGFTHAGDVAKPPAAEATGIYRIFRAPDGATYLVLVCSSYAVDVAANRLHRWPLAVGFEAQTFFTDGGRVDSVNSTCYEYMRQPPIPNTLYRTDHEATDPLAFLTRHLAAVEAFALERGLTPVRHESFDKYQRRQETIHDDDREWYHDHPYSWADHLRFYLHLTRSEQRN